MDRDSAGRFLELYKLTVEMADRVSARRATANAFFLTLNSALIALLGLVRPLAGGVPVERLADDRFGLVLISLAGLVLSFTWWTLLRSYRLLNGAKFAVINEMESRLDAAPFGDEWRRLQKHRSSWWSRYVELGHAERVVPLVYGAVYLAAAVGALIS